MLLLLLRQDGYEVVPGEASSLRQVWPASVDRISPQRRVRMSTKEATMLLVFSGSMAMKGPE